MSAVPEDKWKAGKAFCQKHGLDYYQGCMWFRVGDLWARINNEKRRAIIVHPNGSVAEVHGVYGRDDIKEEASNAPTI
jgi:hypothetical protein